MHKKIFNDQRPGLVKTSWSVVAEQVRQVEPKFAEIVDKLSPNNQYSLFLAYYPYGAIEGDTQSSFLPNDDGGYYRLDDPAIPQDLIEELGYGKSSAPLGMVLNKQLELFIDLPDEGVTIPWLIYRPGMIFPFSRILSHHSSRVYAPNGLMSATAGARSAFMLPSIGCSMNHYNLQRDYNVQTQPPKSLYQHWEIFRDIVESDVVADEWRCCVLYFSQKWVDSIQADAAWVELKQYLYERAWDQNEYERNRVFYDMTFSMIQKRRNLRPNPYLTDTAKHLFTTAVGAAPGYVPAVDESALPLKTLQKAFIESYGLKKYYPCIMQPAHFSFEEDELPVYYSMQHPSTHVFSPKSRQVSSTLFEIRELAHITSVFAHELAKEQHECADTIMGIAAKHIEFGYFHNKHDRHRVVSETKDLLVDDQRFVAASGEDYSHMQFAADAQFLRGCVRLKPQKL